MNSSDAKSIDVWNELKQRQQIYLKCIYQTDQEAEEQESRRWHRGLPKRPADEWRWLLYADLSFGHTRLKSLLLKEHLVNEGTGSTFLALLSRGLIQSRHGYEHM